MVTVISPKSVPMHLTLSVTNTQVWGGGMVTRYQDLTSSSPLLSPCLPLKALSPKIPTQGGWLAFQHSTISPRLCTLTLVEVFFSPLIVISPSFPPSRLPCFVLTKLLHFRTTWVYPSLPFASAPSNTHWVCNTRFTYSAYPIMRSLDSRIIWFYPDCPLHPSLLIHTHTHNSNKHLYFSTMKFLLGVFGLYFTINVTEI